MPRPMLLLALLLATLAPAVAQSPVAPAGAQTSVQKPPPARATVPDCVILLHGLARSGTSLLLMEEALRSAGYRVSNSDYASTSGTVEALAAEALPRAIGRCGLSPRIHFVTHSMGAILLRVWLADNDLPRLGRTVMLAPPNAGSEIVDNLGPLAAFRWLNGPAGMQMATDGLPARLGPVWPGVGVIAGTRSLNPVWSTLLPGPDDGKVSVASTRVAGMEDHIELGVTHTFMMNQPLVIAEVLTFLRTGRFDPDLTLGEAVETLVE